MSGQPCLNVHTLKPIDREAILAAAGAFRRMGLRDEFAGGYGLHDELNGRSRADVLAAARELARS